MQSPVAHNVPCALVVDDNPIILLHVTDFLSDTGFSVFSAADSSTALDWLSEHDSSIVLMFTNIDIPGPLNGFGLANFVAVQWPGIGIVTSSGHIEPERGDLPSATVFLPKPFTEAELLAAVKDALFKKGVVTSIEVDAIEVEGGGRRSEGCPSTWREIAR